MATYQVNSERDPSGVKCELRFALSALGLGENCTAWAENGAVTPGAHQMERITNRLTAEPASTADASKDYSGRTS